MASRNLRYGLFRRRSSSTEVEALDLRIMEQRLSGSREAIAAQLRNRRRSATAYEEAGVVYVFDAISIDCSFVRSAV
jgi:hypothetical protein